MAVQNALHVVHVFVQALWQAGVREVCISPGSRSTPLTMAFARHGQFRLWTLLDERSAGYFALGAAKASGRPVALVCTSGTATANYMPAVMEAKQSGVPLLLLTADRPPELHHTGANQTAPQQGLYGGLVKWAVEMPVPVEDITLLQQAQAMAWRIVSSSTTVPMGPVHVNWPFREPLIPPSETPLWASAWKNTGMEVVFPPVQQPSALALEWLRTALLQAERPLLICGPLMDASAARAIVDVAQWMHVPLLADPLSQCRGQRSDYMMDGYDWLLKSELWSSVPLPDLVVRFGATPTSKVLGQYIARAHDAVQVVVSEGPQWKDPQYTATHVIQGDPKYIAEGLSLSRAEMPRTSWTKLWMRANQIVQQTVQDAVNENQPSEATLMGEGALYLRLLPKLSPNAALFIGNSMPVRDLDSFWVGGGHPHLVYFNRGVSGIDGIVSSAMGVAAVRTEPTVLVLGDVSFFHDLGALLLAKTHEISILVVVVNNDGGGIFSFLAPAEHPDTFPYFQTSHGLEFGKPVDMFGGQYAHVSNWDDFSSALDAFLPAAGLRVIEVKTDIPQNVAEHRSFAEAVQHHLRMRMDGELHG